MKTLFCIAFALALVVGLGLAMASPVLAARTIHVPGDYPTIQQAVDAAGPGDTITVSTGTYAAFQVIAKSNIRIVGAKGATVATTNLYTALPVIGNAWVLAVVYNSTNVNVEGINFDGTGVTGKTVVVGIAYVDSAGRIADLTVEKVRGTELGAGVAIIGHASTSAVEMTRATISNNDNAGIYVCGGSTLEAHFNKIVGNAELGVVNYGGKTVDATRNWWGHASGPRHTTNLLGMGNAVTDGVDFRPWLGDEEIVIQTVTDRGVVNAKATTDAEVEVDGNATVTVARYGCNPGGPPPSDVALLGKYFNVYVPDATQVNEVEIRLYYTDEELDAVGIDDEESLRLFRCNGNEWEPFSDTGVNTDSTGGYSGYIWARIGGTTALSLGNSEENLNTDGGGESPSNPPVPCCTATTAAASGTNVAEKLDLLREFRDAVLLPDSSGAKFVSLYYGTSPPVAKLMSQHELLRTVVRVCLLEPIVAILGWSRDLWSAESFMSLAAIPATK